MVPEPYPALCAEPKRGRVSRRVRSFPITPRVTLRPDERAQRWLLSVSASDRAGLLYGIARVLARHHINLQLAKITTLGERVLSVASLSKAYGLPGLRVGWLMTRDPALNELFLAAKEQMLIAILQKTLDLTAELTKAETGSLFLLDTDGVTEAMSPDEVLYTPERFFALLEEPASSAPELIERVKSSVFNFIDVAPRYDDVTMLAIQRTGGGAL